MGNQMIENMKKILGQLPHVKAKEVRVTLKGLTLQGWAKPLIENPSSARPPRALSPRHTLFKAM